MKEYQNLSRKLKQFKEFEIVFEDQSVLAYDKSFASHKPFMVCRNNMVSTRPLCVSSENISNAQRVTDIAMGFVL